MIEHDLVIRGGTVVDGSGSSAVDGDVAVDDGRVTAVGRVHGRGREELDARGLLVTPGFVDVHTHYDAQVTWDPLVTPSIWHGVTTVVVGNCGVGFAPAAPDRREWLIGLMEGVEDIPGVALRQGIRWDWVTIGEYLAALDRTPLALDVAVQIAHGAVRAFVMGERGAHNEPATAEEMERMADVVRDGVAEGAVGLSVNRLELHRGADGREVPGTYADLTELAVLARAVRTGAGEREAVFAVIFPGSAGTSVEAYCGEIDWVANLSRETGLRATFPFQASRDGSHAWRASLAHIESANAAGAHLFPQINSHRQVLLCGLTTRHAFAGGPTYGELARLPLADRSRRMADPSVRARILSEGASTSGSALRSLLLGNAEAVFPFRAPYDYEPAPDESLAAVSFRSGREPVDVLYDWTIADDGHALVMFMFNGYPGSLDATLELLVHPDTVLGLGDGGAHVGMICDAGYPTHVLGYWARDRERGRLRIEEAVRALTAVPAALHGMRDRGIIAPGRRADLNLIDPDRIALGAPRVSRDLPAGAKRILQGADGFVATLVAGVPVQRNGADTGARPGAVFRGSRP